MLPEILSEQGWNTYMVGKWHLCRTDEMTLASTRRNWPSGRGFERWYGFLGAETNQWFPDLVYDNHFVDQPRTPDELHYVNNFVGIVEQMIVGSEDVPTGHNLILSASFEKESIESDHTKGTLSLYHGDKKMGEAQIKTQLGAFAIAGAALCVGRHSGEPVTDDYPGVAPYTFAGGTIDCVAIDVSGEPSIDLEREAALTLMRE
jgi:Sulfatase